jgi:hypothetical protein
VFITVRVMCHPRFSAEEQDFCVKGCFRIGNIASESKTQCSMAIPRKNINFLSPSVFKCETAVEECERRPVVHTSRRINLEESSLNRQIKGKNYHFEDRWKV